MRPQQQVAQLLVPDRSGAHPQPRALEQRQAVDQQVRVTRRHAPLDARPRQPGDVTDVVVQAIDEERQRQRVVRIAQPAHRQLAHVPAAHQAGDHQPRALERPQVLQAGHLHRLEADEVEAEAPVQPRVAKPVVERRHQGDRRPAQQRVDRHRGPPRHPGVPLEELGRQPEDRVHRRGHPDTSPQTRRAALTARS
jgi:hypothetical protein